MWDFLQNLFTALLPIVTAFAGWAGARIRNTNQKDKAVERGVKMLLRAKIIDLGLHYLEVGEIPPYGMETLKGCYKEYEALGDGDHSEMCIRDRTISVFGCTSPSRKSRIPTTPANSA